MFYGGLILENIFSCLPIVYLMCEEIFNICCNLSVDENIQPFPLIIQVMKSNWLCHQCHQIQTIQVMR